MRFRNSSENFALTVMVFIMIMMAITQTKKEKEVEITIEETEFSEEEKNIIKTHIKSQIDSIKKAGNDSCIFIDIHKIFK